MKKPSPLKADPKPDSVKEPQPSSIKTPSGLESDALPLLIFETIYFARAYLLRAAEKTYETGPKKYGHPHYRILYFVCREPGITGAALGRTMNVTNQALSRAISASISDGMIRQELDDADRRVKYLFATDKGLALMKQTSEPLVRKLRSVVNAVGTNDVAAWFRVCIALLESDPNTKLSPRVFEEALKLR